MLRIVSVIGLCGLLAACGNDESKLPKDCQDLFAAANKFDMQLETNPFIPVDIAQDRKTHYDQLLKVFKKSLFKSKNIDRQIKSCNSMLSSLEYIINQLDNAKSEDEVRKIFPPLLPSHPS